MNGGLVDLYFRCKIQPIAGECKVCCGEVGPVNYLTRLAGVSVMTLLVCQRNHSLSLQQNQSAVARRDLPLWNVSLMLLSAMY